MVASHTEARQPKCNCGIWRAQHFYQQIDGRIWGSVTPVIFRRGAEGGGASIRTGSPVVGGGMMSGSQETVLAMRRIRSARSSGVSFSREMSCRLGWQAEVGAAAGFERDGVHDEQEQAK